MEKAYAVKTTAALLIGFLSTVPAEAGTTGSKDNSWTKKREFVYFLPKTDVAANVGQRILRCPETIDDKPAVETVVAIVTEQGPDPSAMVRIDGRSGFLAKRTTKLALTPDGTLTSFNAATEGQGGEVVAAAVKIGVTAATMVAAPGLGIPPISTFYAEQLGSKELETLWPGQSKPAKPSPVQCNARTKAALAKLAVIEAQIALLEKSVAEGEAGPAEIALLEQRRTEQKEVQKDLTLTPEKAAALKVAGRSSNPIVKLIAPIDYSAWFDEVSSPAAAAWLSAIPGKSGFIAKMTPNKPLFDALSGDGSSLSQSALPYLFYRRPVPVKVTVQPCKPGTVTAETCEADESPDAKDASDSKKLSIPQLSGLYAIAIGSGGLFGSREASATFDSNGAPTALEYGSGSAGGDAAKLLAAANEGAVTLRDSELAALKRAADEASALKTIHDAKKALEDD